jgi:hypothetical protein
MTLSERKADIVQRRLELLMARSQQSDAIETLSLQRAETDKRLHALDGALEVVQALEKEAADGGTV